MRRFRILGLCLVAAFAMSIVAASAASAAEPEYISGGKTNTFKIAYVNTSNKAAKLEGAVVIECQTDKGKGDLEGAKATVKLKVEYKVCEAPAIQSSCQKAPSKPGIITTNALKGELVYASEKSGGPLFVANKLNPETKPEFAKFTCGPKKELSVSVTGTILARPNPINEPESLTGQSLNEEKVAEEGFECSKQRLLFVNGGGLCQHLATKSGTSWNVSDDTVTYKVHKVEVKG